MGWTANAQRAVQPAARTHDDNIIEAAATYAEELAHYVGAQIIDTDLWPQALAEKREQKRAGRADAARWAH
jgi:hypothetical protein